MANLKRASPVDVRIRIEDEKLPPEGIAVRAEEFAAGGIVFECYGVHVTAFEVKTEKRSSQPTATASTMNNGSAQRGINQSARERSFAGARVRSRALTEPATSYSLIIEVPHLRNLIGIIG